MHQVQDSQPDRKPTKGHINAPILSDFFALKEETRMRWFVLYVTTALSLILIGADLAFAFINHNIFALIPSPLITALWIPMVRHLFPGQGQARAVRGEDAKYRFPEKSNLSGHEQSY